MKKSIKHAEKIIYIHERLSHATKTNLFKKTPSSIKLFTSDFQKNGGFVRQTISNKITIKKIVRRTLGLFLDFLALPRIKLILPKKFQRFDYVLSNFSIVLSTKKSIYGPLEHIGDIVGYKYQKLKSPIGLFFLKHYFLSNQCKYVFFMSKSAKDSFLKLLNITKEKNAKFHVVYPTLEPVKLVNKPISNSLNLLYIARLRKINPEYSFYVKGGHLVIKAFKELKRKYSNLRLIFVGFVPPEYQNDFETLKDLEGYPKGYEGNIMDLFQKADIFLFPSYIDGYGYTIIEAMANSLPVVCLNNHFAAKELVLDNQTGFVINTPLKYLRFPNTIFHPDWIQHRRFYDYIKKDDDFTTLEKLITKIEILICNDRLRIEFGKNGKERLISGNLSYSYRNEKLKRLFKT